MESVKTEGLSAREREIAGLAAEGLTDKEIANHLHVSVTTIRTYWNRMRRKLEATNRAQAIVRALDSHLESSDSRDAAIKKVVGTNLLGVVVTDEDGRVIQANDALLRMLGFDEDESFNWSDVAVDSLPDDALNDVAPKAIQLRHRDGHVIDAISAAMLCDSADGVEANYIFSSDLMPKSVLSRNPSKSTA